MSIHEKLGSLALAGSAFLAGCGANETSTPTPTESTDSGSYRLVTTQDFVSNPCKYLGENIEIQGYLNEDRYELWINKGQNPNTQKSDATISRLDRIHPDQDIYSKTALVKIAPDEEVSVYNYEMPKTGDNPGVEVNNQKVDLKGVVAASPFTSNPNRNSEDCMLVVNQ